VALVKAAREMSAAVATATEAAAGFFALPSDNAQFVSLDEVLKSLDGEGMSELVLEDELAL